MCEKEDTDVGGIGVCERDRIQVWERERGVELSGVEMSGVELSGVEMSNPPFNHYFQQSLSTSVI